MADRLPPSALQENASFAAKFIGGTTNLAQRRRYQEDIQAAMDERTDMEQRQFQLANRAAELADPLRARSIRATEQRLEQGMEQFEGREERLTKDQILRQKALEERISEHDWKQDQQIMAAEDKKLLNDHTRGLMLEMADVLKRGTKQGTEAFANEAFERVKKYSRADPKVIQNIFKDARIGADVNDVLAEQAYLEEQGIKTRMRLSRVDGKLSAALVQVTEPAPRAVKAADPKAERMDEYAEYKMLVDRFNKEGDPEFKKFLEVQVQEKREKIRGLGATPDKQPAPVQAPAATATEKPVAASSKLYKLTEDKKIKFDDANILASVQQALDDNLIEPDQARKILRESGKFKVKE